MRRAFTILFGLSAALLAATGCTRHRVERVLAPGDGTITIAPTTTRASVNGITDMQSGFRVFAVSADAASTGDWYPDIDGSNNHVYRDGQWDFETPVTWPVDPAKYPMSFYAWYPVSASGMSVTATPAPQPSIIGNITIMGTAAEQVDILASTANVAARPVGGNLGMTFDHILSKVDFGIIPGRGVTPEILALAMVNAGDRGRYDFVAGQWANQQPTLYSGTVYDYYGGAISEIFTTGSNGSPVAAWSPGMGSDEVTPVSFFRAHTTPTADEAHLMLMPQTNPVWTQANAPGFGPGTGAFVAVLYRMTTYGGVDEVGFASAADHPDHAALGNGYTGPLYAMAAFPLPADANGDFTWDPGKGYDYNVGLGTSGSSDGYLVDDRYFDDSGNPTDLLVKGKQAGDPLNDGVIHVTLGVGGWGDEDGGSPVEIDVNIIAPEAPYIIYWDDATQTMQMGSWNAVTGGAVKTENQLFFRFGGTTGFLNLDDPFDATDIKFNVTNTTDYVSLPNWYSYTGTKPATDGYISTAAYHNVANVTVGFGDPCRLVGLTVEQVRGGVIDNRRFRMPTVAEYGDAADWTITGTLPTSNTFNTTYGITRADGTFLPASGSRNANGTTSATGRTGFYWMSGPYNTSNGYAISWTSSLNVARSLDARFGIPVRCVGQTPYPVSAAANTGGTAKVTSDRAGANVVTEASEGGSVTFTATPTDGSTGFVKWTFSGAGAALMNVSPSDLLRNPLTVSMPGNALTAVATFGPTSPPVELTIPHDGSGMNGAVWATSDLANTGVFSPDPAEKGSYFQWARDVAWAHPGVGASTPNWPGEGADQAGVSAWPEATDPCPDGWRVPTSNEWSRLYSVMIDPLNEGDRTLTGAGGNITFFAGGYLTASGDGRNHDLGIGGYYMTKEGATTIEALDPNWWGTETMRINAYFKADGLLMKCVKQIVSPVSAMTIADGTAKVTSDVAGTTPITEARQYQQVTFTATPADPDHGFAKWTLTGAGASLMTVSDSELLRNPLTVSMPDDALIAIATFGPTAPVGTVTIPYDASGAGGAVWATTNLINTGVFAVNPTDRGVFFQWGREVPYAWAVSQPALPATAADQIDAANWPETTDPCPDGWRVPTDGEWWRFKDVVTDPQNSGDRTFTSSYGNITLPAAGYIHGDGNGYDQGLQGRFWSSVSFDGTLARDFFWSDTNVMNSSLSGKTAAWSIRCVKTLSPLGAEVTVAGVTWAGANVAASGSFADSPLVYDGSNKYTFDEVTANGGQGVCPDGWRTPTEPEFQSLIDNSVMTYVADYNGSGINGWEFSIPGSIVFLSSSGHSQSSLQGTGAYYRTSTQSTDTTGIYNTRVMSNTSTSPPKIGNASQTYRYSVRCVKTTP